MPNLKWPVWVIMVTGLTACVADARDGAAMDEALATFPPKQVGWHIHDPSGVQRFKGRERIVVTGKEQHEEGYACGLEVWSRSGPAQLWTPTDCLFTEKPEWIAEELPQNDGAFWAPSITAKGHLLYSVSGGFEALSNCIGVAYRDNDGWRDSGAPISCIFELQDGQEVSTIDPSSFTAFDGSTYLVTGGGMIHMSRVSADTMRPAHGDWFTPQNTNWHVVAQGPFQDGEFDWVEAAHVLPHDGYYYLLVNWGTCCNGLESSYEIRMGRSTSPTGPFVDKNGIDMRAGGGSLLLGHHGNRIGPGHASTRQIDGDIIMGYHFYDAKRNGLPWFGEAVLAFETGWPVVTRILPSIRP